MSHLSDRPIQKLTAARYPYFLIFRIESCAHDKSSAVSKHFYASDAVMLKNQRWLINESGKFVDAASVTLEALSNEYDISSEAAQSLIDFLGIESEEDIEEDDDDSNLTDRQRELIALANKMKEYGIEDEETLEEFKQFMLQRDAKNAIGFEKSEEKQETKPSAPTYDEDDENNADLDYLYDELLESNNKPLNTAKKNTLMDIVHIANNIGAESNTKKTSNDNLEPENDSDELLPSSVDYNKKIERAKEKSAAEIEKIAYWEQLNALALAENKNNKYSYKWFNILLEMESIMNADSNSNNREVSISFGKVEKEPNTKRMLVLKHPNRHIPHFMEDLSDIPLILHIGDQVKTVPIEVSNVMSYTLRVKLKNADSINGVNLNSVTAATIDAKSPVFLLEELKKQFAELQLDDEYNLQEHLTENIEFVFGPPGTGKTTYLATNVLMPLMKEKQECKVLVLAPTNQSADVLVRRIMESAGNDHSYNDWLVRFGSTSDEDIEQSLVYKDKTFDIRTLSKSVTVTTIARFPYDYYMPQGKRLFLHELNWDYIVIDEASMIPIANIVYPLYKKEPKKFIIAGDPFQIEPITAVDIWKNENIYSMVHLDSFETPNTIPHHYNVELLTTQYRSIPDIGDVFSNFAYGGVLKHSRTEKDQRQLNVGNDLGIETLNIIKYPVKKYESIYRCKRLQHSSSYQIYSALFVYEYVSYLARKLSSNNEGEMFKIGVIAPYRAQADLIDKLLASEDIPKEIDVQVGTIHGFQGDECDIVFAVFNTPPTISDSKEMFLNKKNIINVSISRARDYLFIVMPDDNTENVDRLRLIKQVETLVHTSSSWQEFSSPDLEELMFGDARYLENNAFSTSHQSVNVYGLPEKCYEVRAEDNAIDVQIHKNNDKTETTAEIESEAENYDNPYALNDELIPELLRDAAIDLPVSGDIEGWFYLIPYEGKISQYTEAILQSVHQL